MGERLYSIIIVMYFQACSNSTYHGTQVSDIEDHWFSLVRLLIISFAIYCEIEFTPFQVTAENSKLIKLFEMVMVSQIFQVMTVLKFLK